MEAIVAQCNALPDATICYLSVLKGKGKPSACTQEMNPIIYLIQIDEETRV